MLLATGSRHQKRSGAPGLSRLCCRYRAVLQPAGTAATVTRLQRAVGNHAVAALLGPNLVIQRDASSQDFAQGHQEGLAGNPKQGAPRIDDALTDYEEGWDKGHYEFEQANTSGAGGSGGTGGAGGTQDQGGQTSALSPSGATPTEQPASFAVGGLPAFRYNLPPVPLASAHIETPQASIDVNLSMIGNVSVTFPNAPKGVSTDIDAGGWRLEATSALGGLTEGIRVNGIGTQSPSIGFTLGTGYDQTEIRFIPPNTMAFRGQAKVAYTKPSPLGPVQVQGQPGVELRVTRDPASHLIGSSRSRRPGELVLSELRDVARHRGGRLGGCSPCCRTRDRRRKPHPPRRWRITAASAIDRSPFHTLTVGTSGSCRIVKPCRVSPPVADRLGWGRSNLLIPHPRQGCEATC